MSVDLDVAVVGAGIAGLTAAHELSRAGLDVRVFESSEQVGGRMAGFRRSGYTVDTGAEQISTHGYRATWQLMRSLGIPAEEAPLIGRPIGMWRDGVAHPGVSGRLGPLARAGLSGRARLDLARFMTSTSRRAGEFDPDAPEDSPLGTKTVAAALRGYHPDLHDFLFQPIAECFFGWDTGRSTAAPMISMMLEVGDASHWRTYRDGMDTLARTMAGQLAVSTGEEVRQVIADRRTARLVTVAGTVTARSVLLCVPAPVAARLHANPPPAEHEFLTACTFTSALKVSCLLDRPLAPPAAKPLYLLLTPDVEESVLSCVIVDHEKHLSRVPRGKGLLSLMAAPRMIPALIGEPDPVVVDRLTRAAGHYVPGLPAATLENFVHRFEHALPEATPHAMNRRGPFLERPPGPVDYAGDWVMLRPSSEGAVRAGAVAASRTLRWQSDRPNAARSRKAAA
jgi:oxygen-dependent protoporphyrinogen oxidase